MDNELTTEELLREVKALRRRVEELEVPARRFQAMFDAGALSFQVLDPTSRSLEVNGTFERLWRLRLQDLSGYLMLEDQQLVKNGVMPGLLRAFHKHKASILPVSRYDPGDSNLVGNTQWVAACAHPVVDAAGRLIEVLIMHLDVGAIKQTEEELQSLQDELHMAVAERTAELEEKLRVIQEQQRAIQELSTPVLRLWDGILAVPLIGTIDAERAGRVQEGLLSAIVEMGAEQVIIDITGVSRLDAEVMRHLLDAVRATRLLGATCLLVGVSPESAKTIVELGVDIAGVATHATLAEGLRHAFSQTNRRVERVKSIKR